jgi:archaellum component FlaG (FlaF/FlaG flagellin family)
VLLKHLLLASTHAEPSSDLILFLSVINFSGCSASALAAEIYPAVNQKNQVVDQGAAEFEKRNISILRDRFRRGLGLPASGGPQRRSRL